MKPVRCVLPPCWSRILAEGSFAKSPRSKVPGPAEYAKRSAAPCFAGVRGVLNYLIIPLWLSFKFLDRISGQDLSNPLLGSSPGVPDSARPPAVAADWRTFGGSILGPLFGTLFFPSWSALGRLQGRKKLLLRGSWPPQDDFQDSFQPSRGPKGSQAKRGQN